MRTDGGHEIEEKDLEEMETAAVESTSEDCTDHLGVCKFCGQLGRIYGRADMTEAEINEKATVSCMCEAAQEYANKKEQIEKAKKRINETFGKNGENTALDERIVDNLISFVDIIAEKKMKAVTIDIGRGLKARVSLMAKGSIKVERTETTKASFEE